MLLAELVHPAGNVLDLEAPAMFEILGHRRPGGLRKAREKVHGARGKVQRHRVNECRRHCHALVEQLPNQRARLRMSKDRAYPAPGDAGCCRERRDADELGPHLGGEIVREFDVETDAPRPRGRQRGDRRVAAMPVRHQPPGPAGAADHARLADQRGDIDDAPDDLLGGSMPPDRVDAVDAVLQRQHRRPRANQRADQFSRFVGVPRLNGKDHEIDRADLCRSADGLAEDITTRLGRLRWLLVAARNSSFVYRGKTVDARQVGEELGVRYILDGSVQRSGVRLRISARLSDAEARQQVWANQYDVELDDFLTLQDVIAESVVAAIEPRLHAAEHQRVERGRPENLDAWGLVMKAMPYVWTWGSSGEIEIAQALLVRALEIDPNYPRANSLMAWTYAALAQLGWTDVRAGLSAGLATAQRAVQHDPEDPWAHAAAGYVHMVGRDFDLAVGALKEAINLNPSFALAHMILASTYGYGGESEEGLRHVSIADRLSPRDFAQAANFATTGLCHFVAGNYAEGLRCERKAVELRPYFVSAWRTLAACAGMAGEIAIATQAVAQARILQPSLSLEWVETYHSIVFPKDRQRYLEGLRLGGLQ